MQAPTDADPEAFEALVGGLQRMNGGTNIVSGALGWWWVWGWEPLCLMLGWVALSA